MTHASSFVLTVIDHTNGTLSAKMQSVMAQGQTLAAQLNASYGALVLGSGAKIAAQACKGVVDRAWVLDQVLDEEELLDALRSAADQLTTAENVTHWITLQNGFGLDVAAVLAGRLDLAIVTDVLELHLANDTVVVQTTKLNGAVTTTLEMSCVQKAIFAILPAQAPLSSEGVPGTDPAPLLIEDLKLHPPAASVRIIASSPGRQDEVTLEDADVVVCGGKGLGGPEPFTGMLQELASELGAAIGASRAAVDAGWASHAQQVGQTGKTVAPQLYFALAISGQIQHRVGMQTAATIIAVNNDAHAPIVEIADLMIVGDVFAIVPALTRLLKEEKVHT